MPHKSQMVGSYSKLHLMAQCPKKFECKNILLLPDPSSPAAERGTAIHAMAEGFIVGTHLFADEELRHFSDLLHILRSRSDVLCEHKAGFDNAWREVEFFDRDVWMRVIYDVIYYDEPTETVEIKDWKTGKPNTDHSNQLQLYCATGLLLFPEAKRAHGVDHYLDHGPSKDNQVTLERGYLQPVLDRWARQVQAMQHEVVFPARPGDHCRWCPYSKPKGGPCIFG